MSTNCPLCKKNTFNTIYTLSNIPIFQNKVYSTPEIAKDVQTHDISLLKCAHCNFVFNGNFTADIMEYDENYQNEQNHSEYFKNYLNDIIKNFHEHLQEDSKIVEIGSGKGYFLELLEQNGFTNVFGFDPAYEGSKKNITKDYFSEKYSDTNADIIILRHTLEHIDNPFDFLNEIANINLHKGKIFIEVPCFDWICKKEAFWDIFYEHCNYFTLSTLQNMFHKSESGTLFNEQYIYIYADLKDLKREILTINTTEKTTHFFQKTFTTYKQFIQNNNCAIWGAGAKGVTFLNTLDPNQSQIHYVVDINPKKQNRYIARTAHLIIDITILKNLIQKKIIDSIIIMNENYKDEIIRSLQEFDIKFLTLGEENE